MDGHRWEKVPPGWRNASGSSKQGRVHGIVVAALAAFVFLVTPAAASAAGYTSTGGDLELRLNGSTVELVRDGSVVASEAPGASWTIHGADGVADTLTVRNPDGGIVPARVAFSGGDGEGVDALRVIGGGSDSARALADGPDSGSLVHTRGDETLAVDYAGLEPVVDTTPAPTFPIDYGPANDTITIDNGVAN